MNLISRKTKLTGIPGVESIGYDDWSNQCQHDFNDSIICDIQYQGLKIRAATEERIMFITHETITANDETKTQQGIECLLEKEDDDLSRLVQQRILNDDETANYLYEV